MINFGVSGPGPSGEQPFVFVGDQTTQAHMVSPVNLMGYVNLVEFPRSFLEVVNGMSPINHSFLSLVKRDVVGISGKGV